MPGDQDYCACCAFVCVCMQDWLAEVQSGSGMAMAR